MCRPQAPSIPGLYETVVYGRAQRRKRRWARRLTLLAIISALIGGAVLWQCLSLSALDSTANQMLELKNKASVVRLFVIALLFMTWPWAVRLGTRIVGPSASHLRDARVRACGWLLVIELLVGQNLLGRALG